MISRTHEGGRIKIPAGRCHLTPSNAKLSRATVPLLTLAPISACRVVSDPRVAPAMLACGGQDLVNAVAATRQTGQATMSTSTVVFGAFAWLLSGAVRTAAAYVLQRRVWGRPSGSVRPQANWPGPSRCLGHISRDYGARPSSLRGCWICVRNWLSAPVSGLRARANPSPRITGTHAIG
jgi:hypothetical protein